MTDQARLTSPLGMRSGAVQSGVIVTPLQRPLTTDQLIAVKWFKPNGTRADMFKSTERGAATCMWRAMLPLMEDEGGAYCEDNSIGMRWRADMPACFGNHPHAADLKLSAQLWTESEEMTGVSYAA